MQEGALITWTILCEAFLHFLNCKTMWSHEVREYMLAADVEGGELAVNVHKIALC